MCLSIAINRPNNVLAKGEHLGFQWIVVHNDLGYRCGYVRVPLGHPWHGKGDWNWEEDASVDIHGGITFAEADVPCDAVGSDTHWWLGFDCAHAFDAPDPALLKLGRTSFYCSSLETVRTQSFVEAECRSLCRQAAIAAELEQLND
jgi:hypothetical protein